MQKYFLKQIRSQNNSSQSGQIAIIVLLIMVVLLIVGLSLARRTSEEILLSGQVEDTTRVFNAAETGIEEALSNESKFGENPEAGGGTVGDDDNVQYQYSITPENELVTDLTQNEVATVYLASDDTGFEIDWATQDNCDQRAALIVSVYYDDGNSVFHEAVKPNCYTDTSMATGFEEVGPAADPYKHHHKISLDSYSRLKFARIRPLYHSTDIRVTNAGQQMYTIRSEGTEQDPDGRSEQRAIEVTRTKPAPPAVFDYALYSGGDLKKD